MEINTKDIESRLRKEIEKEVELKYLCKLHSKIYDVIVDVLKEEYEVASGIFDYYKDYEETEEIKMIKKNILKKSLKYYKMMKIESNEIQKYLDQMNHHNIKKNSWEEYLDKLEKMHQEADYYYNNIKDLVPEEIKEQMIQGVEKKKELTLEEKIKYNFKSE